VPKPSPEIAIRCGTPARPRASEAGLAQATNGEFYGTTIIGGAFGTASNSLGFGTVFNLFGGTPPVCGNTT